MIIEVIAASLAAFSFGVLFNIKGKRLVVACIGGGLGWLVYKLCLGYQMGEASSCFISAICFSIYCEICARIYKTPATTLTVCCLIPLVPGYGVYNTMYEFIIGNYAKGMDYGINTLAVAGALALGVIFVSTIFRNIKINKIINKIEKRKEKVS
ncbi:threonine/serine exporter family protein [Clostridium sp. CCUG 7971]|uniref:threonine/serine exporter family protein n=1 Tax=Clostridium sp. CCUG 7971 TaxID=2811414 RepID=UPI001ABA9F58|nr:threonine/serine exporter family protein [Clostridium sp. CCUG 7971]MBO3443549.1 threonine/serine exporter family protein [Clostridium sp. CCUG 7971]